MDLGREEKLEHLEKVLQSRALHGSESLKAFLRFVVQKALDNQEMNLKEYTIATEVFGRNSNYDSRIDSVVRVQAGRLRSKLQEYYVTEGKDDKILITLPKGHYYPVFSYAASEADALRAFPSAHLAAAPATIIAETNGGRLATTEEATADAITASLVATPEPSAIALSATSDIHAGVGTARSTHTGRTLSRVLGVIIVALVLAVLGLSFSNRELRRQIIKAPSFINADEITTVWGAFLSDPEPPLLALSNPAVYRFVNKSDPDALTERAIRLNAEQARVMDDAPEFKGQYLPNDGRPPRLIPSLGMYTGMGEAIGLYRLADLFRSANKDILLKQSRLVSAADLKYRNVILLGSIYVNDWSRKLPPDERFVYTYSATIENRHPLPGEEHEYKPQFDKQTGELRIDYALITVKPNVSGEHAVMTLAGIYSEGTEAAAEFVTTRNHLAALAQRLHQLGGKDAPLKYYQALLKVGVENGTPTTITLLALHPLNESGG